MIFRNFNFEHATIKNISNCTEKRAWRGYTVTVPALPGCITYGEDVEEAISMAEEVIELYIEEL